jgi:hypothetical protein
MPLGSFRLNTLSALPGVVPRTASTISSGSFSSESGGKIGNYASGNFTLTLPAGKKIGGGSAGTVEFWLRVEGIQQQTTFAAGGTSLSSYGFQLMGNTGNGNRIRLAANTSVGEYTGAEWSVSTGVWYHFALTTSGNNTWYHHWNGGRTAFTNSEEFSSWRFSTTMGATFDEIRFSDNIRYPTSFTPATTAFTNDANTLGLFHCESNSQGDDTA